VCICSGRTDCLCRCFPDCHFYTGDNCTWFVGYRSGYCRLFRLAECLLPLLAEGEEEAVAEAEIALEVYKEAFNDAYLAVMREKLGLLSAQPDDLVLSQDFLKLMAGSQADFTIAFRRLCDAEDQEALRHLFADKDAIDGKQPGVLNFTGDDRNPGLRVLTPFRNGKQNGNGGCRVIL